MSSLLWLHNRRCCSYVLVLTLIDNSLALLAQWSEVSRTVERGSRSAMCAHPLSVLLTVCINISLTRNAFADA